MNKVQNYYTQRVNKSKDLLYQVGKTVNGESIDNKQFNYIVETIKNNLELTTDDLLADFGCGNGVLTNSIAPYVRSLIGIERNQALYHQANKHIKNKNILLFKEDILHTSKKKLAINKAYSYEVVQHLSYLETKKFVSEIMNILPSGGLLFLGGIPDEQRKWNFYDSKYRRSRLAKDLLSTGADSVGTWFIPDFFYALEEELSISCKVLNQHPNLYTTHYRFDCLLRA
ncbi:rRNA adenine N-6-methyltransferase family protein [Vreelandella aquamarina]